MKKKEVIKVISERANVTIQPGKNNSYIVRGVQGRKSTTILCLSDEDVENYKLIGTASGEDFFHCLYMAHRNEKNFLKRVIGYTTKKSKDRRFKIEVSFYEVKK